MGLYYPKECRNNEVIPSAFGNFVYDKFLGSRSQKMHLDCMILFPDELKVLVLSYLTPRELCLSSAVSHEWRRLANDEILWKHLCIRDFDRAFRNGLPILNNVVSACPTTRVNWKEAYAKLSDLPFLPMVESMGRYYAAGITSSGKLYVWGKAPPRCHITLPSDGNTPFEVVVKGVRFSWVSASWFHLAAISEDGTLYTWGSARYSRLGHEDQRDVFYPRKVDALDGKKIYMACASLSTTHALTDTGQVYSWGDSFKGKLGHSNGPAQPRPRLIAALVGVKIVQIACGRYFSLYLSSEGDVYSCGWGENGCLAHNNTSSVYTPTKIRYFKGKRIVFIAGGKAHAGAVADDGRLYMWGLNSVGQLSTGDTSTRLVPTLVSWFVSNGIGVRLISLGYHSVFLSTAGKVYTAGLEPDQLHPRLVSGFESMNIITVSAGESGSMIAIDSEGHLFTWGRGDFGQLGRVRRSIESPSEIPSLSGLNFLPRTPYVIHTLRIGQIRFILRNFLRKTHFA